MRTKVDIISGSAFCCEDVFIKSVLESGQLNNEKILIFGCNKECTSCNILADEDLVTVFKSFEKNHINEYINKYLPDRIVIECSDSELHGILEKFNSKDIKKICNVHKVISILDAQKLDISRKCIKDQILESDLILLINTENMLSKTLEHMKKDIFNINGFLEIYNCVSLKGIKENVKCGYITLGNKLRRIKKLDLITFLFLMAVFFYFTVRVLMSAKLIDFSSIDFSGIETFTTMFISIIIQAFPFILIGTFISSFIQIIVPNEIFIKIFPKNIVLANMTAILAGFLFPVCDCASVPVTKGLIKKNVPVSAAITFMLSAPIINPIVIASTLFAFPNSIWVVFSRIGMGILIALITGILMQIYTSKDNMIIFKYSEDNEECLTSCCHDHEHIHEDIHGLSERVSELFIHTGEEFFEVGKFLVIGAFLSTFLQTVIFKSSFVGFSSGKIIPLIVMMLFAFVLSICSTSDAFVARSFLNQFSIGPVIGFLVVGPMIDIKNTLMITGSFTKKFFAFLICSIFIVSFTVLLLFNLFYLK